MTGLAKLIKGLEEEYERATTYEIIDEVGLVDQFHDGYRTALIRCLTLAREELTQETRAQTMTIKLDERQFQLLVGYMGVKLPDEPKEDPITSVMQLFENDLKESGKL